MSCFFKNELEQPSGSFKLRGIGHLVQKSIENAITNHPNKKSMFLLQVVVMLV